MGGKKCCLSPGLLKKTLGAREEEPQRGSRGHKSAAGYTVLAGLGAKGQAGAVTSESNHPHTDWCIVTQ